MAVHAKLTSAAMKLNICLMLHVMSAVCVKIVILSICLLI